MRPVCNGVLWGVSCLVAGLACYGRQRGPIVATEVVPGSERVVLEELRIVVSKRPQLTDPTLVVTLVQNGDVSFDEAPKHQELRVPRKGLAAVLGTVFGGAGVALVALKGDTTTRQGRIAGGAGALVALVSLIGMLNVLGADPKPTGRLVRACKEITA